MRYSFLYCHHYLAVIILPLGGHLTGDVFSEAHLEQGCKKKKIKTGVDTVTQSDKLCRVKSEIPDLPELISNLRKATARRGMKGELAQAMGLPLPRISEWLAGTRKPGGDKTLKLLRWVKLHGGQQKSRGRALTPPQPKTRSTKISHEKRKSNPSAG
jgi:DNA-binding transcriptional regulator YiaG